ncbi:DNA ligase 1 [Aethina tumida]|uniref:DNA ligase 1 n=1 Tax=Aethina tumida TaxID=116153 RepID=UPI002148BFED|nr:DNA ligase 1 [Aethina tumida]
MYFVIKPLAYVDAIRLTPNRTDPIGNISVRNVVVIPLSVNVSLVLVLSFILFIEGDSSVKSMSGLIDEEQLIRLVREHPALYDMCHVSYHNHLRRDIIWEEIADKLESRAEECRKKWQSLRDLYRKSLRKKLAKRGKFKPWRLQNQMAFMKEYMDDRNKVKRENNEDDEDLDQLLEKEKASKGRLMNINEQKLIELVENNPHLYNPHDANYHNHSERDKSWVEIAEILDHDPQDCREKWRTLRDCYRKCLRNRLKGSAKGKHSKNWRLENQISFITPFLENDGRSKDLENSEDISQDSSIDDETLEARDDEEKRHETTVRIVDHLTKYFESAEETLRTFPADLQIEAKRKISEVIHEYEMIALKRNCSS